MPRCIAFLRAVNVGGRTVRMALLRAEFEALGLAQVETFIASGNVIFETRARDLEALQQRIEARLNATLGFEVHTFIRSSAELVAITDPAADHAAFDPAEVAAAGTFVVGFFARPLDAAALRTVAGFNTDADRFQVRGRELYWLSRQRQNESAFSNAVLEKALHMRATLRGVSTLRKLKARLDDTRTAPG